MLTPDEIEDIITDLSCRNAAGGIYTGSVHPFARAIEKAAEAATIERCAKFMEARADEIAAADSCTANMMAMIYRDEAKSIRALLPKEE